MWHLVLLLAVLGIVVAIRVRLLDLPLERDEGEYAYAGQLMLQGVPPYQEVYNMKWPGTYAAYALILAVFGQTPAGIHTGLLLVTLATAALVFVLTRRLAGELAGLVAAGIYALLSITPSTLGLFAHAGHFVILPALGGICLLQNIGEGTARARVLFAGVLFGLAALMKQPGAVFGGFAILWLVYRERLAGARNRNRLLARLGWLALGSSLPLLLTGVVLVAAAVFGRFWLWTVDYARAYAAVQTPLEGWKSLWHVIREFFTDAPALWGLTTAGLILFFCDRELRRAWVLVLGFSAFSFLAICPGLNFREHYFLLLLPAAGMLAGIGLEVVSRWLTRWRRPSVAAVLPALVFAAVAAWSLYQWRAIYFQQTPDLVSREIYGSCPFAESLAVADYLKSHCPPDARIAVVGSEPEIYFYSRRRSATGYIYTYPLMEPQPYAVAMQQEMIREIERADPAYLIFVNVDYSWLQRLDSNLQIFDWFGKYSTEHFRPVGLVEIFPEHSECRWGFPPATAPPRTRDWLAVFQNKKLPLPDR
jgi:hypothetical protein